MIYGTGDCHGEFGRLASRAFPRQKELTKSDCVVVMGDAGFLRDGSRNQEHWLDWLEAKPFTLLDVGGNHENYDLLEQYPRIPWQGGMARQLRPSVLSLCRGYVFRLHGRRIFVMGGAQSHDADIILKPGEDLSQLRRSLNRRHVPYRVEGESWWARELPGQEEYQRALEALEREHWMVDLVFTHCAPTEIQRRIAPEYPENQLTDFLQRVKERLTYRQWYCGHYHRSWISKEDRFQALHEEIIPIE